MKRDNAAATLLARAARVAPPPEMFANYSPANLIIACNCLAIPHPTITRSVTGVPVTSEQHIQSSLEKGTIC